MMRFVFKIYAYLFGRNIFRKLNMILYHLSLRGLGILNYENKYLTGEKYWLKKYLHNKEKPIVIDVGAHIGDYSKDVLSINRKAIVFAFEPHPNSYKKLIENIVSDNFKAFNYAVGERRGKVKIYDYSTLNGSSHATLYEDVIKDLHKGTPISHEVEMITIDEFLKSENIEVVDLLKIDTEGYEFNVLLGCKETLRARKIKAIQFEFNEMNIVSKVRFKDFWDYLKDFEFYRILPGGRLLKIENYSPINCEIYAFQNIVAILKKDYV